MRFWGMVVTIGVCFASWVQAAPLTDREKLSDFDQLVSFIRSNYGPLKYKAETQGISLDEIEAQYRPQITATKTNLDFYYKLGQFVAAFKDGHFNLSIPTRFYTHLGFVTDLVEGKVLIDTIDRMILPESAFPFKRGDELVSIDGQPVADVLNSLQTYLGSGFQKSSRRRAAMMLTVRAAARVPAPTGPAVLVIRSVDKKKNSSVGLTWIEVGKPIEDTYVGARSQAVRDPAKTGPVRISVKEGDDEILPYRTEDSFRCSGKTRIQIPDGATVLLEKPVVIYYHATPKGNVGYLRLPHYTMTQTPGMPYTNWYHIYQNLKILEEKTVGLVIDQDHNCGGQVDITEQFVGSFGLKEVDHLQFALRASKAEVLRWAGSLPGELLRETWLKGDYLTPLTPFYPGKIVAGKIYTKPVVVLIDEMAGSGGDAFPAMMQGYGRAKLIGTRTMGAGGHVEDYPMMLSFSAMNLRLTRSLFYRPDGVPVENNGAVPDYAYDITADDFNNGYRSYQKFYLEKLAALIP